MPNTNDLNELNNLVWQIFDDTNKIMKSAEAAAEVEIPGSENKTPGKPSGVNPIEISSQMEDAFDFLSPVNPVRILEENNKKVSIKKLDEI